MFRLLLQDSDELYSFQYGSLIYFLNRNLLIIESKPPIATSAESIQAILTEIIHLANNKRLALRTSHFNPFKTPW